MVGGAKKTLEDEKKIIQLGKEYVGTMQNVLDQKPEDIIIITLFNIEWSKTHFCNNCITTTNELQKEIINNIYHCENGYDNNKQHITKLQEMVDLLSRAMVWLPRIKINNNLGSFLNFTAVEQIKAFQHLYKEPKL